MEEVPTEAEVEEPQTAENVTAVANQDTSEQTAPLHSNTPTEAAATDGGVEAGAEAPIPDTPRKVCFKLWSIPRKSPVSHR